jgi:hypothetical protein
VLVLRGISMTTSRLFITTSFTSTSFVGSSDGGVRTVVPWARSGVVFARWSKNLFIFFISFCVLCTTVDDD